MFVMKKKLLQNSFGVLMALALNLSFINCVQSQPPLLKFTNYVSGLSAPLDIKNAGDGSKRLFVVEQSGKIRIIKK